MVKSSKYRSTYGENPLKPASKSVSNISSREVKVERVKFFPSPNFNKYADKLKLSPKVNKPDMHPFGVGQTRRIKNEYIEMRRNYLNELSFGHGY